MEPYRMLQRGNTKKSTILDTAALSDEVEFDHEFTGFKVSPEDDAGLTSSSTITLLVNGKVAVDRVGNSISFTYTEDFVWTILLDVPVNKVSFRLSIAATADVVLQVTGYGSDPL